VLLERTLTESSRRAGLFETKLLGHLGGQPGADSLIRSICNVHADWQSCAGRDCLIGSKFNGQKGLVIKPYFNLSQWFDVGFSSGHWLDWFCHYPCLRAGTNRRPWFGPRNLDVSPPKWLQGQLGGKIRTVELLVFGSSFILPIKSFWLTCLWFSVRVHGGLRLGRSPQNRPMRQLPWEIPTDRVDRHYLGLVLVWPVVAVLRFTSVGFGVPTSYGLYRFLFHGDCAGAVGNLPNRAWLQIMLASFNLLSVR